MEVGPTTRRKLLQATAGVMFLPAVANARPGRADAVFAHPANGNTRQALAAITDHGGRAVMTYDNFDFVAARIPIANRGRLERDDRIAFVESDGEIAVIDPVAKPDNPGNGKKNGNGNGGGGSCKGHPNQEASWGHSRIGAANVTGTGAGVKVAVLDTGIDPTHCDLEPNIAGGFNATGQGPPHKWEDKHGHGTHCAGIIGAVDNTFGVVGVAPDVSLYAVKVLGDSGGGRWSWFINGVDWCLSQGIPIMSASLGGSSGTKTMKNVLADAYDRGHILIAAAGNDGSAPDDDIEYNVSYPGAYDHAIAVGAIEDDRDGWAGTSPLTGYSSTGTQVEFVAPGHRIRSTYLDNSYRTMSGTSMACPHVTGVVALVGEVYGFGLETATDGSPERNGAVDPSVGGGIREILRDTADPTLVTTDTGVDYPTTIDDPAKHNKSDGYGLVLADDAVTAAKNRV